MDACLNRASGSAIFGENEMFTLITITLLPATVSSVSRQVGFWAALEAALPLRAGSTFGGQCACVSLHTVHSQEEEKPQHPGCPLHTLTGPMRELTLPGAESARVCVCVRACKHRKARNKTVIDFPPHGEEGHEGWETPPPTITSEK